MVKKKKEKKSDKKEPSRSIGRPAERELWARAGGRCQFDGCNKLLYKSNVTQEKVNVSEKAHIYSFSENGPRGWGPYNDFPEDLNKVENLFLVCHDCHKTIDPQKDGGRYPAELVKKWKRDHERRIALVTGITQNKRSHVVFFGSNISGDSVIFDRDSCQNAMFPERYPFSEYPIELSMVCAHEDKTEKFYRSESKNLKSLFKSEVVPRLKADSCKHLSVFAWAGIPLLIQLGTLLTDKVAVDTYQRLREPEGWGWDEFPDGFEFILNEPDNPDGKAVLIISISDVVKHDRITSVLGDNVSIWELTIPSDLIGNDCIRAKAQLSLLREAVRKVMRVVQAAKGLKEELHVFPAMSISCAVEMGRARMPKATMPWVIYDQNDKRGKFIKALRIGG
jgi:hypothetical protein